MYDIITIGDTQIDTFIQLKEAIVNCEMNHGQCMLCVRYADKIPVEETLWTVAGNSANAAVGFARLGLKTGIYTHIGEDDSGHQILRQFRREKVKREFIKIDKGNRSNHSTVLNFKGERTIFVYHAPRNYRLTPLGDVRWIYLSSMAYGSEVIFDDLVKMFGKHPLKLVYQPGTHQLRFGAKKAKPLLRHTEILVVNKEEAILYTEQKHETLVKNLLVAMLKLGPKIAVITDGPTGAYASDGQEFWFLKADPSVPRIEATGAGDSFTTAFTAARMLDRTLPEALQWGTHNSQSVIQTIGPQAGLLTKRQLQIALKHDRVLRPERI